MSLMQAEKNIYKGLTVISYQQQEKSEDSGWYFQYAEKKITQDLKILYPQIYHSNMRIK